jgi:hypothetical protein
MYGVLLRPFARMSTIRTARLRARSVHSTITLYRSHERKRWMESTAQDHGRLSKRVLQAEGGILVTDS